MRFRNVFGFSKVILPVVHVESVSQALRNVGVARTAGADGVFLIGHDLNWTDLISVHLEVRTEHPELWVGLNLLDVKARFAMKFMRNVGSVDGLWTDNARIDEHVDEQFDAHRITDSRGAWPGLYFGGVAFKGQREVLDVATAARLAVPFMDVVTTSGPATGQGASVEKLRAMKEAVGDHPLAVASGVTVETAPSILPHVDCVLVATGISSSFTEIDPAKAKDLVEVVHGS